jgi:superoxide dismutase, Fe-Mn family
MAYIATDFTKLLGVTGFSETLLNNHFTLYQGYVKNINKLIENIDGLFKAGKSDTPEYAELQRRFGFEWNGMRLHELYFSNLGGSGMPVTGGKLEKKLVEACGSHEAWEKDFRATGSMRGVGWVVLYQDLLTGGIFNTWINLHETGHLAGCQPILVMDVWEHAFISDYGLKRADYIGAFFKNIDWTACEKRLK